MLFVRRAHHSWGSSPALQAIYNYPNIPAPFPEQLPVADASLAVIYSIRKGQAAFTVQAYHLGGLIHAITPIFNAMWVDNPHIPNTCYVEDFIEFDWNRPIPIQHINIVDVRYLLFYNHDGSGMPYACVLHGRQKLLIFPHAGNKIGEDIFYTCSTNQDFKPLRAPVEGFNDTNVRIMLDESKVTVPVRWVVFPKLGWGAGGTGPQLLDRLRKTLEAEHLDWWNGANRQPSAEFFLRTAPSYEAASPTNWRPLP